MKCANGKYKYGEHGNCVFDTLAACKQAAAAIHIQEGNAMKNPAMTPPVDPMGKLPSNIDVNKPIVQREIPQTQIDMPEPGDMMPQPDNWHCDTCQCAMCMGMKPGY
jgi:hypothetical protein